MSHGHLAVTPAHLRDLAAVQQRVATEVVAAGCGALDGDVPVLASHGPIASATVAALRAVQQARAGAVAHISAQAGSLRDHLVGAAHRYETTDHASSRRLQ